MIIGIDLSLPGLNKTPNETQEASRGIGELTSLVRIHDLQTFHVKIRGDRALVEVE